MRNIEIREKIMPFSHKPGTECIVPLSDWIVTIYPALFCIFDVQIPIQITGPVQQFLIQMDLERDCLWVSAIAKEGHYRFKLSAKEEGLFLTIDRCPKKGICFGSNVLKAKESILVAHGGRYVGPGPIERLSLGNWKAQDWDLVCRRNNPQEIVPALYLLGQKTPFAEARGGTASLLIHSDHLRSFFLTAFSGILVPHLTDVLHQGIVPKEEGVGEGEPIALLSMFFRFVRSFLIQEGREICILPHLPKDWTSGRATNLQISGLGRADLEWTKGMIRRIMIDADEEISMPFIFPKEIKSFRCNGKLSSIKDGLILKKGNNVLDRFSK